MNSLTGHLREARSGSGPSPIELLIAFEIVALLQWPSSHRRPSEAQGAPAAVASRADSPFPPVNPAKELPKLPPRQEASSAAWRGVNLGG